MARPDKLTLVPNETFGECQRKVDDKLAGTTFTVEDVIHMAQIVAPSAGPEAPPAAASSEMDVESKDDKPTELSASEKQD